MNALKLKLTPEEAWQVLEKTRRRALQRGMLIWGLVGAGFALFMAGGYALVESNPLAATLVSSLGFVGGNLLGAWYLPGYYERLILLADCVSCTADLRAAFQLWVEAVERLEKPEQLE